MNRSELIAVRSGQPEDFNFIMATFLRGLYYGDSAFSPMEKDDFMSSYHKIAIGLLANVGTKVKVACLKEEPNVVLGYSIITSNEDILHWVFVKKSWRKIGIAKLLVPNTVKNCTHLTALGANIKKHIVFNPFLMGKENKK